MGGVLDRRYVLDLMHRRSRMTIDARIPTTPGRSMSGFHRPGRQCLHQARSAVRCPASRTKGEGGGGGRGQGGPGSPTMTLTAV